MSRRNLLLAHTVAPGSPIEATEIFTYTPTKKRATHTDLRGFTTTYQYGICCDRLISVIDPTGAVNQIGYDHYGNVTSRVDANGNATIISYDGRHRVIAQTNALGETTQLVYDDNLADGQGLDAQYNVADLGFAVGADGAAVATISPTGDTSLRIADTLSRTLRTIDGLNRATSLTYDVVSTDGLIGTVTTYADDTTSSVWQDGHGCARRQIDASGAIWLSICDAAGNILRTQSPVGVESIASYDALSRRLTARDGQTHTQAWEYNAAGQVITTTDALGHKSHNAYDARGRKLSDTDRVNATTTFAYDSASNLIRITDAEGGITSYVYDERGLLVSETFPGQTGGTRSYAYDPGHRLQTRLDQAGITTTYVYDDANRLIRRAYSTGPADTFSYDASGRLIQSVSGRYRNTVTRAYDSASQLIQESQTLMGINLPVSYSYDLRGRVAANTHPDGRVTTRSYDERGLLEATAFAGSPAAARQYDSAGRLVDTVYGNGVQEARSYLPGENLISRIQSGVVTDFSYTYDAEHRKLSETDGITAANSQTFAYDAAGRLTNWQKGASSQSWNLSPVGDWTSTTLDGVPQSRSYTPVHELTAINGQTLAYDAMGNLTQDNEGLQLAWDEENRLITAMNPQGVPSKYAYDALGRRVSKTVGAHTVHYVSAGAQEIVEIRGSLSRYLSGEDIAAGPVEPALPDAASSAWQDQVLNGLLPDAQLKINFQPAEFTTPAGWQSDEGAAFAARAEQTLPNETARTYGWQAVDGTPQDHFGAVARERLGHALMDSTLPLERDDNPGEDAVFAVALAPGAYPVVVIAGDSFDHLRQNDLLIQDGVFTQAAATQEGYQTGQFVVYATVATVGEDGQLRIRQADTGSRAALVAIAIGPAGGTLPANIDDLAAQVAAGASSATAIADVPAPLAVAAYAYGSYVDEPLMQVQGRGEGAENYYFHANHLYSIAAVTDSAGAVVRRYAYSAYGERTASGDAEGVDAYGFTGRRWDAETGLWYFRARYFSAEQGRFIGRDPIGYVDGMSLYRAYFVPGGLDPSGLIENEDPTGASPPSRWSWSWAGQGSQIIDRNPDTPGRAKFMCENACRKSDRSGAKFHSVELVDTDWWYINDQESGKIHIVSQYTTRDWPGTATTISYTTYATFWSFEYNYLMHEYECYCKDCYDNVYQENGDYYVWDHTEADFYSDTMSVGGFTTPTPAVRNVINAINERRGIP